MISNALRQANLRLAKAEAALVALRLATTFETTEVAWTDFLMACSTIYSKLEQGSKSNGKSAAWYGKVKSVRKRDQLLRYVHHARDSDHHGIEDLLAKVESQYKVVLPLDHPMWFIQGMTLDPESTMTSMSGQLYTFFSEDSVAHESGQAGAEIVETTEMVEAGLVELRNHNFGEELSYAVECVFQAMAYVNISAASTTLIR